MYMYNILCYSNIHVHVRVYLTVFLENQLVLKQIYSFKVKSVGSRQRIG